MATSFNLRLDTTAPAVSWGQPQGARSGGHLLVPFALDEPGPVEAWLMLGDGRRIDLEIRDGELAGYLPDDSGGQDATVSLRVRDELDNETVHRAIFAIAAYIEHDHGGGSGEQFVYRPLIQDDVEFRFPAIIEIVTTPIEARFGAATTASRMLEVRAGGRTVASRTVEIRLTATRGPAEHWNAALRDDEDALLAVLL